MTPVSLEAVHRVLGVSGGEGGTVTGLRTDSREILPGECFVALRGSRVDGARFIPQALEAGAILAVGGPGTPPGPKTIVVDDPLEALGRIAALVRERYQGPVVGITGTAGKTTVKEFLRGLVAPVRRAVFPQASFNNREGVPRTLAGLEPDTEVLVVELGTNAPGEIATLCRMARPTMGVITALGPGHLEGLRTIEGVREEKLDLARSLPEGATLFVNGDDARLREANYPSHLRVVQLGLESRPGVVTPASSARPGELRLDAAGPPIPHRLPTAVLLRNLWIALHVARELGVEVDDLARAAPTLTPPPLRGEFRTIGQTQLILDCYNANPLSMQEALTSLAQQPGRRAAVLGQMLELGGETGRYHQELGRLLASLPIRRILFIGESVEDVAAGVWDGGADAMLVEGFADVDTARPTFREVVAEGGTVLLKGSRKVGLERLLEGMDV